MTKLKSIVFYALSFTWGIIMSVIGCLAFLVLMCFGCKPKKFHDRLYIEVGSGWGGVSLGPWFIMSRGCGLYTKQHESGHGFQNALLGPLMPFVVCLPSATRYWIREFNTYKSINVFCGCLIASFALISTAFLVPGIVCAALWSIVVGGILMLYTIIFGIWLWFIERPRYKNRPWPSYYSVWFEGTASSWGEKMYPEDQK